MTETPNEPTAEPDEAYLVPDEDSDFDPDAADPDEATATDAPFVEQEVQDDGH